MKDKTENINEDIKLVKSSIIVLVGMMGVGKTTFGRKLSNLIGSQFLDIDQEIEYDIGHSVSWIFENIGEKEFRKMEEAKIREILENPSPKVVALGGGAFLNQNSRELIKKKAVSIWLKADAETILRRVSARRNRPLLEGEEDKFGKIKRILSEREEIYSKADLVIVTDKGAQKKILDKIVSQIARAIRMR